MSTEQTAFYDEWDDALEFRITSTGKLEIISGDTATEFLFDKETATAIRNFINEFLDEDSTTSVLDLDAMSHNEAKLRIAADLGLRAKFSYRGEHDYRAVERRLVPDAVSEKHGVLYVGGESYDAGGADEGYRLFRLDRISGEVVVR